MTFELFARGTETLASLRTKLTNAGFTMPATAKHSARSIFLERFRQPLRDCYYLGYVTYEGTEYQGRHQPLIGEELFEKVLSSAHLSAVPTCDNVPIN
jgi:site-specific DNA recombinase